MSDEAFLRGKARKLIRDGKVPNQRPQRMWGGAGMGESCALCECTMGQDQIALEVEFMHADGAAASCHFHLSCYALMDSELQQNRCADPAALYIEARSPEVSSPGATLASAD